MKRKKKTPKYALFKWENGKLMSLSHLRGNLFKWVVGYAFAWNYRVPKDLFKPKKGVFVVKLGRQYPDFEFTGDLRPDNVHFAWKTKLGAACRGSVEKTGETALDASA